MIGDVRQLQLQARRLATDRSDFKPFATRIAAYAENFELDKLQAFLRQYLESEA
jgi:hypothetical protein